MQLGEVAERIKDEVLDHAGFLITDPPMSECGKLIERLSQLLQGYAICMLLNDADETQFREYLRRSACANRYFRRKSAEQGNIDDRHLGISRSEAYLDALVAGELELARDIAKISPSLWREGWEYEDDFCYVRLLYRMLEYGQQFGSSQAAELLKRFEQVLEGENSPRWNMCQAIVNRDADQLRESLYEFLAEKANRDDARRPNVVGSDFLFWPQSFVSIEGLAILRLTHAVGLPLDEPFPFCPDEAIIPPATVPFDDMFLQLEQAIAADG